MVENRDIVCWTGVDDPSARNIYLLEKHKYYIVIAHWSLDTWCSLEGMENYGFPRFLFRRTIPYEDVEVGVM